MQREHNQAMKRCYCIDEMISAEPFVLRNKGNLVDMEAGDIRASSLGKIDECQEPEDAARSRRSGALSNTTSLGHIPGWVSMEFDSLKQENRRIQHTSSPTDKGT
ncbi:hypothetical protein O988_00133 [Pseudogymnoascus sp. VKM F-3808]|nr:hypothetical protein O988_00133 [Pseudogymnoascus sp. VKM F-3808]